MVDVGGGGGEVFEKLELVMGGKGGGLEKNEVKVWGVHIIPVGNILNSSEFPQAINSDRSLIQGKFKIPFRQKTSIKRKSF